MPIKKAAIKSLRKERRNRASNLRYKKTIKDLQKQILSLKKENKIKEALELLPKYYKAVDKAAKENVIKKNTANRKKSSVTRILK
ncbi:30S ribosomal protein S20 [Patescibacteria group bacterium]|nr:30S ribosomal protein S20 [Patescibacteria group bacterium]MBU4162028.1 30S ribosomal protein S20 [Patescibacteria group bacterium]